MNPVLIASLLKGVAIATQVIQVGIQVGATYEQLKPAFDRMKQLVENTPLTDEQEAELWTMHGALYASWSRPLGPRPDDAE